jgi:hypothetical protein
MRALADLVRRDRAPLLMALNTAFESEIRNFNLGIEDPDHPLRVERQAVLERTVDGFAEFLDAGGTSVGLQLDVRRVRELGRAECRNHRPLGEVLQAPWVASRTIFRLGVARALELGVDAATQQAFTEALIDWSQQISIAISDGYNEENAARATEIEARRARLVELLLDDRSQPDALDAAARDAGWRLPRRIRMLLAVGLHRDRFRRTLPTDAVAAELDEELWVLYSDALPRTALPSTTPGGTFAALGPVVPPHHAAFGARITRRAVALARDGIVPADQVTDCDEHELLLLLLADRELAHSFTARLILPLAAKAELIHTLAVWLRHQGRAKSAAAELGVHQNTVSYRVERLRELLGDIVDDPDRRLELAVAAHIHEHLRCDTDETPPSKR